MSLPIPLNEIDPDYTTTHLVVWEGQFWKRNESGNESWPEPRGDVAEQVSTNNTSCWIIRIEFVKN